jgi:hypothetical protein
MYHSPTANCKYKIKNNIREVVAKINDFLTPNFTIKDFEKKFIIILKP